MVSKKILTTIAVAIGVLSLPLGILNACGGIVAGIWFIVLGQWGILLNGFLTIAVSALFMPFVMMPSALAAAKAGRLYESGNKVIPIILVILAHLWLVAVTVAWEISIFNFFQRYADRGLPQFPVWLRTYGGATGVFAWMANKAREGQQAGSEADHAAAAQFAFILFSICLFWLGWSGQAALAALIVPLAAQMVLSLLSLSTRLLRSTGEASHFR